MIINASKAYSIDSIIENTILTKDGHLAKVFMLEMPEKYSLSVNDFDRQHMQLFSAFRTMPEGSYVHKQDIGLEKSFDASHLPDSNLLQKVYKSYVDHKPFIEHSVFLIFTLTGLKMLESKQVKSVLGYKEKYNSSDQHKIKSFEETVKTAVSIIGQSQISIIALSQEECEDYVIQYCNGFTEEHTEIDYNTEDKMEILSNKYEILTIPKQEYLPDTVSNIIEDFTDQEYIFYKGFFDDFGESFPYNHIYNQIIYFKGHQKIKGKIEDSQIDFSRNRNWRRDIDKEATDLESHLKDIDSQRSNILVQANFNLILWSKDKHKLADAYERAKTIFQLNGVEYYRSSKTTIQNLFLGSVPGRNPLLDKAFLFDQPLLQTLCLFTNTGNYNSDNTGILYNERIFNTPVFKDTWDIHKKRIYARNSVTVAPTGGGKTFSVLWKSFLELMNGIIVCFIEIGSSGDFFAKLLKDKAVQIRFDFKTVLGINPFKLKPGEELDPRRKTLLSAFCFKLWQIKEYKDDTNTDKAMKKLITHFYNVVPSGHSFPSFYNFIKKYQDRLLIELGIPQDYFNIDSFLHVCEEFMPGGTYENICAQTDVSLEEQIDQKMFIHFELSQIKEDPFLVSIMLHLINFVIDNKILADRSKRAKIKFDEFAETQELKTVMSDDHVLATVAFLNQKIRKENGGVDLIIQSPAQLPNNHYTENIIANTQVFHILEGNNLVYDSITKIMKFSDHDRYLMQSIANNFKGTNPYSEEFLKIGSKYRNVLRLQVPKEIYYAFQTEGADWEWMQQDYNKTKDMEQTILNIMKKKNEKSILV